MNVLDYCVIGLVAFSVLLGWWRGLVYEVLSLLGWGAAYVVARLFAVDAVPYLPQSMGPEAVRMAAAFALLFVATLIVSGILAWLLSKLVKIAGLGWLPPQTPIGGLFLAGGSVLLGLTYGLVAASLPAKIETAGQPPMSYSHYVKLCNGVKNPGRQAPGKPGSKRPARMSPTSSLNALSAPL